MSDFNFNIESIRALELQDDQSDVRLATPERNFGSLSLAREINKLYEDIPYNNVVWQPDVYAEARTVADQFGIKRIVDVGCGNGEKLIHFFPSDQFQTTGLDFHGSLNLASRTFPWATWVECDLNSSRDLTLFFDKMGADEPVLLILSDVIEHLPDPRLLLAQLRTVLMRNSISRLVLSTPDRAMLDYKSYGTYPENQSHVREWTHNELAAFCKAAGFQVEHFGHTRANQFDEKYTTIYMQLRCERSQYVKHTFPKWHAV